MDNKIVEIFIPGPAGRLEAKYYKSKKPHSNALVLQPHPQYGGTMNNKGWILFILLLITIFLFVELTLEVLVKVMENLIMVKESSLMQLLRFDWLERENFDNSQCWVSGFFDH